MNKAIKEWVVYLCMYAVLDEDYQSLLGNHFEEVLSLVYEAGSAVKALRGRDLKVITKNDGHVQTQADVRAEKLIVTGLRRLFPHDAIIAEESQAVSGTSGRAWFVDGLDGTVDFVDGRNDYAVVLGLADPNPSFGIVYFPEQDILLFSQEGRGAFRIVGGVVEPINLVATKRQPLIRVDPKRASDLPFPLGRRRMSLNALHIIDGRIDGFLNREVLSWDLCAPAAILEEAGCIVSDHAGNPIVFDHHRTPEVCIASPQGSAFVSQSLQNIL